MTSRASSISGRPSQKLWCEWEDLYRIHGWSLWSRNAFLSGASICVEKSVGKHVHRRAAATAGWRKLLLLLLLFSKLRRWYHLPLHTINNSARSKILLSIWGKKNFNKILITFLSVKQKMTIYSNIHVWISLKRFESLQFIRVQDKTNPSATCAMGLY